MSDSPTTATPETKNSTPIVHPLVQESQMEAEVDRTAIVGDRVMRSVGGGSPSAPPDRFAGALGQMQSASGQAGMLRQLQRSYGNSYVGAVIQQQGGGSSSTSKAVDVKGQSEFTPPDSVVSLLENSPQKMNKIPIKFGNLATGEMEIEMKNNQKDGVRYYAKEQPLTLSHPLFQNVAAQELTPKLFLKIQNSKIEGSIGIEEKKGVNELKQVFKDKPELIGLTGFDFSRSQNFCNEIKEGKLKFGVDNIPVTLGGVFSGTITLLLEDEAVKFESIMKLAANIKGTAAGGELVLIRSPEGVVTGSIDLEVVLKNFSGNLKGKWDGETFTADGSIAYQGEKLSGNVNIHVMEKEQADRMKQEQKAQPEGTLGKSSPTSTTPSQQDKHNYVVSGEGNLEYQFNDWLHGSAEVIADYDGYITVIGEITPQPQIQLFKPEPFRKDLPEVKARAMYGLPVIADIFIEAGIGLTLWATIEGNLKNIKAPFKYSTDPTQCKNFQLQGTINISAAAGITLHGFVDVGLEILDHEIKVGAGIDGTLGIKGYAEATPIIGYREEETEGHDKKGVFFISGDVEIAAQPFLGLEGKLFVKLDSPFWSPAPDKTWTWPLGDKEWPLGGSFGIGANVDYIFGSGKAPTVSFKEPDFSADKFIGDIVTDRLESKQGEEKQNQGQWQEKNTPQSKPSTGQSIPASGVQPGTPAKTSTPVPAIPTSSKKKKDKPPSEFDLNGKTSTQTESHLARQEEQKKTAKDDAQKKGIGKAAQEQADKEHQKEDVDHTQKWQRGVKIVEQALAYAEKTGIELDELNKILRAIKKRNYGFTELYAKDGGENWIVFGSMSPVEAVKTVKKSQGHMTLDQNQRSIAFEKVKRTEEQLREDTNWRIVNQSIPTASEPVVKPEMSAELAQKLKNLPPLKEPDERLEELQVLLKQPGLKPEVVKYLQILARNANEQAKKEANDFVDKSNKNLESLLPHYRKNLAQASVTIKKLLEKRGPNYLGKTSKTPYDQVMGSVNFSKLPQKVALSPDHLYSLHYIANSAEITDLIEIFSKASDSDKATMIQKIPDIGDVPENLFSMRSDANSKWKKEHLWSELNPADGKEYGYTVSNIQEFIEEYESPAIKAVKDKIKSLADLYRR